MEKEKCTAIVLAAGSGSRMKTATEKQFLELDGKPLICYALDVFEQSEVIDECILVTGENRMEYVKEQIVGKYGYHKVTKLVAGGKERYDSVRNAMKECSPEGYIFIHDGARPFVTEEILKRGYDCVTKYKACVAAVPSKDTVKITDEEQFALSTPDRKHVWIIQTPQIFDAAMIKEAYAKLPMVADVTDDASVIELLGTQKVRLFEGSYENSKVTTPDDLDLAEFRIKTMKKSIDIPKEV